MVIISILTQRVYIFCMFKVFIYLLCVFIGWLCHPMETVMNKIVHGTKEIMSIQHSKASDAMRIRHQACDRTGASITSNNNSINIGTIHNMNFVYWQM